MRPLLGPLVQEDVKGKGSKSGDGKDKRGKTKKAKVDGPGKPVNGEIAKVRFPTRLDCDPSIESADGKCNLVFSALRKALQAI